MFAKAGLWIGVFVCLLSSPSLGRDRAAQSRGRSSANSTATEVRAQAARGSGCTFDIECDDGDPCTVDSCSIAPGGTVGSGACAYANVPAGQPGDCDDGVFCNGSEYCGGDENPVCQDGPDATCCGDPELGAGITFCTETLAKCDGGLNAGRRCTSDAQCAGSRCDHCHPTCTTNADCSDGLNCNGAEVCVGGTCQPGSPPCGEGALCSELRCSGLPITACNSDQDCAPGQTCTQPTPVCFTGRCCSNAAEPICTVTPLRTPTVANPNPGLTCLNDWFPGDNGQFTTSEPCGGGSPYFPGEPLGCPEYGSGIAHIGGVTPSHPVKLGPVSISMATAPAPSGPGTSFHRLGDDYALSTGSHLSLRLMLFHGAMDPGGEAAVEFWDTAGTPVGGFTMAVGEAPGLQRFDFPVPLVIPSSGFVTLRPSSSSPNSRLYWSSTTQVEAGTNNANLLFVNDAAAANFLGTHPGILSFELVGESVAPPLGACILASGECRDETNWACGGLGGSFLGAGEFCATCMHGFTAGTACRTCQGGTEPGDVLCTSQAVCDARGMGGTCLPNSSVCTGSFCSNDADKACVLDAECPARFNRCSNADMYCVLSSDCPSGGTCGAAGTCEAGVCQMADTANGACCEPLGVCTDGVSESTCTSSGGEFQGIGTSCDARCCPQPVASGADNCEEADVYSVPALAANDLPFIVTISGDNSGATSTTASPDTCFGAAESIGSDRGWWEGFTLNSCARVRVDFCCSQPQRTEVWRQLFTGCPCGSVVPAASDPNLESPYTDGAGAPYCEDGNGWVLFGLLGPGTYYYPIHSALPGPFGPYQLHITAEPCPTAACCLPGGTCQVMDQLSCEAASGVFLGLPNKFPAEVDCTGDPCGTGSCCLGLGQCDDLDDLGEEMTQAACDAQSGSYLGGIRCHACTCVNDSTYTCTTDADCATSANPPGPGGACNLAACEPRAEQIPSPCPFCPFEGPTNCQLPNGFTDFESAFSDLSLGAGQRTADDFVPGPGVTQISELCVWGQNWGTDPADQQAECGPSVFSDNFHVRVLAPGVTELPDNYNVIGESDATSQKGIVPNSENVYSVETYAYHLVLTTPITGLVPGQRYWLEVTNTMSASEPCYWMWVRQATASGNSYSAGGTGTRGYPENYARSHDMTFCTPGTLDPPPVEERPCCSCNSTCTDGTLAECNAMGSAYDVEAMYDGEALVCNADYSCHSQMRPANDDCQNATPIPVGNNVISTFCATEDGFNPVLFTDSPDLPTVPGYIGADVWFEFIARQDCMLRADMCATGDEYDSTLAVYSNETGSCVCPLDQFTHDMTFIDADDESCALGEAVGGAGFIETPAQEDQCFMIRVGRWLGGNQRPGLGLLDVSCGDPICGDNSVNSPAEECDGVDDALCPGSCAPPGDPQACTCGALYECFDGVREGLEECDGADDDLCYGNDGCTDDCRCVSVCGDGGKEGLEECDGPNDLSCGGAPGRCLGNCTCPPAVCGNDFKDFNEECDGTDDALCAGAPCRVPGDPAGECTCTCFAIDPPSDPLSPNTFGTCNNAANAVCDTVLNNCTAPAVCEACNQNRYLSFKIPATTAGTNTAIRVRLDSLHNPSPPPVGTIPDFTVLEGGDRFLDTVPGAVSRCCNPSSDPTTCNAAVNCNSDVDCGGLGLNTKCYKNLCPDSTALGTYFRCARLTTTPEYRDWSDYAGSSTYATGASVIPSSSYSVTQLAAACAGNEGDCVAASAPLTVITERWGNVDCSNANNGVPNAADVGRVVDKVKDGQGAYTKARVHLRAAVLDPLSPVNAQCIGRMVDAVKGLQYPFNIQCTTTSACTTNAQCTAPATCSANGRCTTVKDPDTGLCQP